MTRTTSYLVTKTGNWSDVGTWTLHARKGEAILLAEEVARREGKAVKVYRRTVTFDTAFDWGTETMRLIHTARRPA